MRHLTRSLAGAALATALAAVPAVAAHGRNHDRPRGAHRNAAAVFVQTDATSGNAVRAYRRAGDGTLAYAGTYATGGNGAVAAGATADPLASQGSLTTAAGGRLLLAVNAGSNTISVFRVAGTSLSLRQTLPSGGIFPASIAVHDNLVYVLNSGADGTVSGFRIDDGRLRPIAGSTRSLGLGNTPVPNFLKSPGQVGFAADGHRLVVTTKASTSSLDVFGVNRGGLLGAAPVATASATPVPFAFASGPDGELVVAEAATSTISAYTLAGGGSAHLIGSQADGQAAACWITSARGVFFVSNAGSANVSAYRLNALGAPQLVGIAGTAGAGTTDSAAADHGHFLYVESGGAGTVDAFAVSGGGALTKVGTVSGLPTGIEGIATVG